MSLIFVNIIVVNPQHYFPLPLCYLIYLSLSNSNLEVHVQGGRGLPKLREGDACLVDLATVDEREVVRYQPISSSRCSCIAPLGSIL